jgi:integrase
MRKPPGLKKRGSIWHISKTVRVGERRIELSGSTGCTEIADATEVLERRVADAKRDLLYGRRPGSRTFADAAVEYVLDLEQRGKSPTRAIQDLKALDPYIGATPLRDVCQDAMAPFYDAKRGVWKSGSVRRATRTASAVLTLAARVLRDDGEPWLPYAPPKLVPPDWNDARLPRPITWAEQDRLIAELPAHARPVALFLVHTGCREQEALGLQWAMEIEQAGFPAGSLFWLPKDATKTAARILVVPRLAREVMPPRADAGLVFRSPRASRDGSHRWDRLTNKGWLRAREKAQLDGVRVHDLRHTYGKRLEAAGVAWEYRQALLGHALRSVTELYSGPGLRRLLDAAESVSRETEIAVPGKAADLDRSIRLKRRT